MDKEHSALVNGKDLPISTKQSIEICNLIRGQSVEKSKNLLNDAIKMKKAIPFRRFNMDMGHKKGMAAGRYPQKASKEILKLIDSVEANANEKGLDIDKLYIKEIIPNKASRPMHYGRKRGLKMKRTHIKLVVEEYEKKDVKKEAKMEKKEVKQEPKVENKVVEKVQKAKELAKK